MTHVKTLSMLALLMMALAGCSSSSGEGSEPPEHVTVVVPPSN